MSAILCPLWCRASHQDELTTPDSDGVLHMSEVHKGPGWDVWLEHCTQLDGSAHGNCSLLFMVDVNHGENGTNPAEALRIGQAILSLGFELCGDFA